jgi:sugar phosphate permease
MSTSKDSGNSRIYSSYTASICVLLLPLFIGLASSNKLEGGVRGIVAIVALIGLPIMVCLLTPKEPGDHAGFKNIYYSSICFSVTFVIVIIAMLVSNN